MNTKMHVGNLSFNTLEQKLRDIFSDYGTVTDLFFPVDKMTGRPRGFAFVTMDSTMAMNEAIKGLNGKEVDGRTLNITEARPKEERAPYSGNRGGNGGYGNRY
ncbi:MAG TPA: RNA-binding protein [Prosthecobacter sp.]